MARVFVSHASEDLVLACELHGWLVEAGHEVFLDRDLRDGIAVGEEWEHRLQERLRWANAMVCVVTSAYVASSWCLAEVSVARSRGNRLLPVQAEQGIAHALLRSIQHTDLTQDWVIARASLTEALRRIDEVGDPDWPDNRSPFPGLRPFDSDQHRVFFGRNREVEQLAELLRSTAERAKGAVLLVVGPSGCGKSSLVRAGLAPVMAGEPGWWTLPPIVPGIDPVAALAGELVAASREIGLNWMVEHVHRRLDEDGLTGLADELLVAVMGCRGQGLLIVVDQFEELLTQTGPTDQTRFAELLRPVLTGPVQVVGTLRSEFLDQLLSNPELAGLQTRTYTLRPLRHEALRAVIEEPARLAGIGVDERLLAQLVDDTGSGDALPLLAFTLAQLTDGLSRGGQLSKTRYDQLGGVQGALTREADAALADAVAIGAGSREQVIGGLLRLVTIDEHGHPTRLRVRRNELPDSVITAFDTFVTRRLLTTDTDNGSGVIGVAHEAFLTAWPPLTEAITASASALRARRAVEHAATEWSENGRPTVRLWGGGQLAAAVTDTGARIQAAVTPPQGGLGGWLPRRNYILITAGVDLSPRARDFLHTSIRHDRNRRRRATTILSVLLVLALAAAGVAFVQQHRAEVQRLVATNQRDLAVSRELATKSEKLGDQEPTVSTLLSIAAWRIAPTAEARSAMLKAADRPGFAEIYPSRTEAGAVAVAFRPDGKTFVIAGGSTVSRWDTASGHQLGESLTVTAGSIRAMGLSPDGSTLALVLTSDPLRLDGILQLWDLGTGRPLSEQPDGHLLPVTSLAFSPDGKILASGSEDGTVQLWGVPTGKNLGQLLSGNVLGVTYLSFSATGKLAITTQRPAVVRLGESWSQLQLWDVAKGIKAPVQLADSVQDVTSMAFDPRGNTLVTAGGDGAVQLWDVSTGKRRGAPLAEHGAVVDSLAFSPSGATLAGGGADDAVRLWDVATGKQVGEPLIGHTSPVRFVVFNPDGETLATVDAVFVRLWKPFGKAAIATFRGHTGPVNSVAFNSDGKTLASGSDDKTVWLWDTATGKALGEPFTDVDRVTSVAFSRDGTFLATADGVGIVQLHDGMDYRTQRADLYTSDDVQSLAFSPDGKILATATHGYRSLGPGGNPNDSKVDTVQLWGTETGKQIEPSLNVDPTGAPAEAFSTGAHAVVFSPKRNVLVAASENSSLVWWDTVTHEKLHTSGNGRTDYYYSVAFSPDGNTVVAGKDNNSIEIFDAVTYESKTVRLATTGVVSSMAFSPDGSVLAAGIGDNTVQLYDTSDYSPAGRPWIASGPVHSVAFNPDGKILAGGIVDGTVQLWDTSSAVNTIATLCAKAGRSFDPAEWSGWVPAGPAYRQVCP